jgi:mono/diheme cytochrome c family protein
MHSSGIFSWRFMRVGFVGSLIVCGVSAWACKSRPQPAPSVQPLSANDVSWLFPAPTQAADFANLIAVRDITTPNPQDATKRDPVWPDAVFQRFVAIAENPAVQVAGQPGIGLPAEAHTIDAWFVAGIRIDAGAPGLANDVRAQFGQLPEIRLIIQPVTHNPDGTPKVADIAGHLIFNFTLAKLDDPAQPGCLQRPQPDLEKFSEIVADVAALRTKLSAGQLGAHPVVTAGAPLGVHPGLSDPTTATNLRQAMKSLIEKYISAERLQAMAIAGVPAGAAKPWIFLSIQEVPPGVDPALPNGGFDPVHGPTLDGTQFAQLFQAAGTTPRVLPEPHSNNLNPITCKNAAVPTANIPIAERSGFATAELFAAPPPAADKSKEILDVIADPSKSHFFNTDCVSCHTETRRTMELLNVTAIPGINSAALPGGQWDVRNFGWGNAGKAGMQATVTRRTANETAAVITFINSQVLSKRSN